MRRKISGKTPKTKVVPAPLGKVATPPKRAEAAASPRQEKAPAPMARAPSEAAEGATIKRASHADLIARSTALAPEGEGVLVLIVSTPRGGKSDLAKKFARARALQDIVLVHDPKIPPNYPWAATIPSLDPQAIASADGAVIRFDERTTPDDLVRVGMALARGEGMEGGGITCTTIIDENMRATSGPQTFDGPNLKRAYTEGSSQGHSLIALTQIPQWCPTVQIDFSQAIILGRNGGRTLSYAQKNLILPDECARTIQRLEVGEWVLISRFEEWDRTVYYSPQEN
jgi:hypothetical protein